MEKKAWEDKAWETVRRALGKLVSHVAVRDCASSTRAIPVQVRCSNAVTMPDVPLGQAKWRPDATVHLAPVPSAGTGLRESSLLPAAQGAAEDCALAAPDIRLMPVVQAEAGRVESAGLAWLLGVTRLPDEFVRLPTAPVRIQDVPLPTRPDTVRLTHWGVNPPAARLLRLPRVESPCVRWGSDSVVARMPLARRASGTHRVGDLHADALSRRLAEATHLPPEEVELLGVYPGVPILAVSRIVVEDEGRQLRFWLKPEVLRGRTAPHLITLLVGRQKLNGKMLQAAL